MLTTTMSSIVVLFCVGWFALATAYLAPPNALENPELHFEQFIQKFEKNYANEHEKQLRFKIFKESLKKIEQMNKKSEHAVFGITKFADMTHEELSKHHCLKSLDELRSDPQDSCQYILDKDVKYDDAPESLDWRDNGAVTAVKDQGDCGSCFAFSAVGSIEGQHAIKNKELVDLSEQQVVDCDKEDHGCNGGLMNVAIRSLIDQGGVETEADYPYQSDSDKCKFDASKVKVNVTDCRSYNLNSQEKLKQILYHTGPIAIGIQGEALMSYEKGILSDEVCNVGKLNHGVLLVGYGSEDGKPYWIVKNSWGARFGEKGYFRVNRGEGARSCGMMNEYMASAIVAAK